MIEFRNMQNECDLWYLLNAFRFEFSKRGYISLERVYEYMSNITNFSSVPGSMVMIWEDMFLWNNIRDSNVLLALSAMNYGWTKESFDVNDIKIETNKPFIEKRNVDENTVQIIEHWNPGFKHIKYSYFIVPDAKKLKV